MRYKAILADPPWYYSCYHKDIGKRTAESYYRTMKPKEIMALGGTVQEMAADDCILFLWATYPQLPTCLKVMEEWGFTYKTVAFTWVKMNKVADTPFVGMGFWTRSNAEICLLGTRGHPQRQAKNVRQVILSKIREHSRKPDEQYERIEALVDGPYLEMFARPPHREGWDVWGDESEDSIG